MPQTRGRPRATTRSKLEQIALALFDEHGFEATTVDDIAAASGVGRRTFFRYYPSKNDVVWGDFEELLAGMERWLAETDDSVAVLDAVTDAVVRFNSLPPEAVPAHRQRMAMILHVPALQAHSNLRYADWRAVIARFVAHRSGTAEDAALPQLLGHVALAAAVASYEQWLADPAVDLQAVMADSFAQLKAGFPSLVVDSGRLRPRGASASPPPPLAPGRR